MPIGSELLSQPNTISNGAWFKLNCTASGAALNASNTSNVQHLATQAFDFVPGTIYRLYVEADPDEVGWIAVVASQVSGANDCLTYFNLSTGAFGTLGAGTGVTVYSRKSWEVSSGRWGIEVIFSGASTPGAGKAITVIYTNADNTPAFVAAVGDGVSIHTISLKALTTSAPALPHTSIGTLPAANEMEILTYWEEVYNQRVTECPLARATTYYFRYNAAGTKFGGGGAGTSGSPYLCASLDHIKNLVDQKIAPDTAFLFECGSEWYGSGSFCSAMLSWCEGVTFGPWGSGNKPLLAHAELVSSGWTLDSGTVYTRTVTADIAQVLEKSDRTTPLAKQTSSTDVATIPSGCAGSWYRTGTTLYINIGENPNGVAIELVHDNTNQGVEFEGHGWRFDGIDSVGFGADTANGHNQVYHIKFKGSGAKSCLVTNWRAYCNSTHGPSQNCSSSGGYFCVRNCEAHGAMFANETPTMFNAYVSSGDHEALFIDITSNLGEYPAGLTPTRTGALFYSHTNGVVMGDFFMAVRPTVGSGSFAPIIGGWEHIPATSGDYTLSRAFVIDHTEYHTLTHEHADICWINPKYYYTASGSGTLVAQQSGTNWRGYYFNPLYEIETSGLTAVNFSFLNKVGGTVDADLYNWAIYYTGSDTNCYRRINHREIFDEEATGILANGFIADLTGADSEYTKLAWDNDAAKLLGNRYYNLSSASDSIAGYDADATGAALLVAPTLYEPVYRATAIDPSNPAAAIEYDIDGLPRHPRSIGPWGSAPEGGTQGTAYSAGQPAALSPMFSPAHPPLLFIGGAGCGM